MRKSTKKTGKTAVKKTAKRVAVKKTAAEKKTAKTITAKLAKAATKPSQPAGPKSSGAKITPFLWFDGNALEAAQFYVSIFKNSKITSQSPMSVTFVLDGQNFYALNGGPHYKFTEAISFYVSCDTQKEIDYFWDALSKGGSDFRCGWLKDKFGLSWQIIPTVLGSLLGHKDRAKADRAMQAMLKMEKLDIQQLLKAAD